jgi:hypothetical protein
MTIAADVIAAILFLSFMEIFSSFLYNYIIILYICQ